MDAVVLFPTLGALSSRAVDIPSGTYSEGNQPSFRATGLCKSLGVCARSFGSNRKHIIGPIGFRFMLPEYSPLPDFGTGILAVERLLIAEPAIDDGIKGWSESSVTRTCPLTYSSTSARSPFATKFARVTLSLA
jgi:hypothetical protein